MNTRKALIGTWEGGADDGSGLRTMIYNFGIEFRKGGQGISFSWSNEEGNAYQNENEFEWKYLADNKIKLRYKEDEWETIEFEVLDYIGAYKAEYFKLIEKGKETFWNFPEPVYKSKPRKGGSILKEFIRPIVHPILNWIK